jgi:hypothetical protein
MLLLFPLHSHAQPLEVFLVADESRQRFCCFAGTNSNMSLHCE